MKKITFSLILMIVFTNCSTVFGQISGNQVYKDRYSRNNNAYPERSAVIIRDSIMMVSADILLNMKADSLIVTLGLNQEAKTVKETNSIINKRINTFISDLKGLGISEKDFYVDFVAQGKIYDYKIVADKATQYLKGFEIKKNIIIKINASSAFDKVIDLASEHEIYDIVKVDYVNNNIQEIYTRMMLAASTVTQQKKDVYLTLSPIELLPTPIITSERFFAVYPNSQYKEYEAFETSDIDTDDSKPSLVKNIARKNRTFYYDKIDQSEFDLIINNASPVVGIQYVLQIQVQFKLKGK
jgi:uncharacterized protein YggE